MVVLDFSTLLPPSQLQIQGCRCSEKFSMCLMLRVLAAALEHICELWGIPTSEAVMVGDSAKVRQSRSLDSCWRV